MDSWFKRAEGLFEVVDRRAKLVVSEFSEEQSDSQSPASNGQGSQAKRTKSKAEAGKRSAVAETPKLSDFTQEQSPNTLTSQESRTPVKDGDAILKDNKVTSDKPMVQRSNEQHSNLDDDYPILGVPVTETSANGSSNSNAVHLEMPVSVTDGEYSMSTLNGELLNGSILEVNEENSLFLHSVGDEVSDESHTTDVAQSNKVDDADVPKKIDYEKSQSAISDFLSSSETELKSVDVEVDSVANRKNQQEHKTDPSSQTVQEQLDEAQGLLKTAISTGQSKEARLARVCAGLSARLREKKSENEQLEELLVAERELSKSCEARIRQLQQDLSASKSEVTRIESNMAEALAAKNSEIEALVSSMETHKKQAALSEGNLASLQANMESMMRNRELTETRMMQALREELASAERRAEEERAAHNTTKMAAMQREVELERRAIETSTALARIQRVADERTAKATELEQKVAQLEVECANLSQELQDMEARTQRGQKKSPEEANQVIQVWQEEVERARQVQRDAESKLSSMEAEVQKLRVEMAAMKRDAEHYSRQEHMELEKRYRELTDLLYYKQTQLETMASEKAAAEFQLDKELRRLQEAQVEVERSRVSRRASPSWEEDTEIKALEPPPFHHRHMAAASIQLREAAKLLDKGAVRATRFLWRYPTARVILLFYLVFVHLFLMYLLHRLQEQADSFSAREVAESMGLQ